MPKRIKREAAVGFGARLARLRKETGISQTAFAQELAISQRMMAYYEGPGAHPPGHLLPEIAKALGVSVEALLGTETAKRKTKAVDTRMQRRLQQLEKLDARTKRQVMQLLDTFIVDQKLRQKVETKQPA